MTNAGEKLTRRTFLQGTGTVGGAALIAGCGKNRGGGGETQDGETTRKVEMTDDLVFDPADVTVSEGTTVVWENVGTITHTVTAYNVLPVGATYFASGGFDSESEAREGYPDTGGLEPGDTFEHTFEMDGSFDYFCVPHESEGMQGTITVTDR